jgi:hypothetical protein
MDFDFELLGPRIEGGSDERTRSSSDVSSQFDSLSGGRFWIATLGKRYLRANHCTEASHQSTAIEMKTFLALSRTAKSLVMSLAQAI